MHITLCEVRQDGKAVRAAERELTLDEGATAEEALSAAGVRLQPEDGLSVFNRRIQLMDVLHDGDRLEVSAPLITDPREARRRRAELQGDVRVVTAGRHGGRHRLAEKS